MDRTVIAPWKAEEKELSEKLYKKLHGLALLVPPTEDFRKCISEEMFLKPNPQAFFHCMHFLFRLIDPVEFKKRFFWPITDRRSEANFRASTVEYLKHLNEKHQLQWTNIKSYLVVMPGGMKFITFMLDLVGFVIQELTRQREKQLNQQDPKIIDQVSAVNLKLMRRQNEFFKEYASAYMSEVDAQSAKLHLMAQQLEVVAVSQQTALNIGELLKQDAFYAEFAASNERLFRQQVGVRTANIERLERPLCELKEANERFQSKEAELKYDKDTVRRTLRQIRDMFPMRQTIFNNEESFVSPCNVDSSGININRLIAAFNSIYPTMEAALVAADQKPCAGEFVEKELASLLAELQQIEVQITDFQKVLNTKAAQKRSKARSEQKQQQTPLHGKGIGGGCSDTGITNSRFLEKYVCTPPIKLEMPESSSRIANTRLALLDDFQPSKALESFHNFPAMPSHSVRKPTRLAESSFIDLNNTTTMNKSRIIDPITLLRTINKDTTARPTPQQHSSVLGLKWKQRQNLFGNDLDAVVPPGGTAASSASATTIAANCTINVPDEEPITPFNSNDHTRITRSLLAAQDMSFVAGAPTLLYAKKMSAVKKVLDSSLNLHNLSTSPSGRLDALVSNISVGGARSDQPPTPVPTPAPTPAPTPKLQLNDCTLNIAEDKQENMMKSSIESTTNLDLMKSLNIVEQLENVENNINVANVPFGLEFPAAFCLDEDEISNMSDSVLRDITM